MDVTALFIADAIESGHGGMDVRGAGRVFIDVPELPAAVEVTSGAIARREPESAPQLLLFSSPVRSVRPDRPSPLPSVR